MTKRWAWSGVGALGVVGLLGVAVAAPAEKSETRSKPAARKAKAPAQSRPTARPKARAKATAFVPRTKVERIVEKMVAAMGGRANQLKVASMMAKGSTQLVTPLGERTGKLVTYLLKPHYQRVDMDIAGQKITQSFFPGGGWLRQGSAVLPMPRSMLSVAKAEAVRSDVELRYFRDGVKLVLGGERRVNKQPCYVIHFVDKEKRRTTYAIARKTWLPLQRSYQGPSPLGGGKTKFSTYQSDFRWVSFRDKSGKIRVPFHIENYMNNRKIGSIQLHEVKLNPPVIKPSFFRPPNPTE